MSLVATWEGIADAHHNYCGLDAAPVSAYEQAHLLGLTLRRGALVPHVMGRTVYVPRTWPLDAPRTHGAVAHELGHVLLERDGEDDSEDGARYLAGALMLPRRVFVADARRLGRSLSALRERHLYASAEMIAHRMVQLLDVRASIYDQGKLAKCLGAADSGADAVGRCYATGEHVSDESGDAWPVFNGVHRRVVWIAS